MFILTALLVLVVMFPMGAILVKQALIEQQITSNYVAMWEDINQRDAMLDYALAYFKNQQGKKGATNVCKAIGPTWEGAWSEYHCITGLNTVTLHVVSSSGSALAVDYRFNPPTKRGVIPGTYREIVH